MGLLMWKKKKWKMELRQHIQESLMLNSESRGVIKIVNCFRNLNKSSSIDISCLLIEGNVAVGFKVEVKDVGHMLISQVSKSKDCEDEYTLVIEESEFIERTENAIKVNELIGELLKVIG